MDKKPAGKKESADSSGSSLLEFAFQSALFGNTLFGDKEAASPTPGAAPPPQGGTDELLSVIIIICVSTSPYISVVICLYSGLGLK